MSNECFGAYGVEGPAPEGDRPVFAALASLEDALNVHEKLLCQLVERLQPVLHPQSSQPNNSAPSAKDSPTSLVSQAIQKRTGRVRMFCEGLAAILDRLEV